MAAVPQVALALYGEGFDQPRTGENPGVHALLKLHFGHTGAEQVFVFKRNDIDEGHNGQGIARYGAGDLLVAAADQKIPPKVRPPGAALNGFKARCNLLCILRINRQCLHVLTPNVSELIESAMKTISDALILYSQLRMNPLHYLNLTTALNKKKAVDTTFLLMIIQQNLHIISFFYHTSN